MKTLFLVLKRALQVALVLAVVGLVILFFAQDFLLFPGRGTVRGSTTEWKMRIEGLAGQGFQSVEVPGPGGVKVRGLWSEAQGTGPALIWFHGREENITTIPQVLTPLRELGYHIFVMEYRGYSSDSGSARQEGILADAEAVFDFLAAKDVVAARRICAGGVELGANVALQLAARRKLTGVIAVSVIPDMASAVAEKIPVVPIDFLFRDKWKLGPVLPQVACPVLFVHGTADSLIPGSEVEMMGARITGARVSYQWVNGAGHRDVLEKGGKGIYEAIDIFIARAK